MDALLELGPELASLRASQASGASFMTGSMSQSLMDTSADTASLMETALVAKAQAAVAPIDNGALVAGLEARLSTDQGLTDLVTILSVVFKASPVESVESPAVERRVLVFKTIMSGLCRGVHMEATAKKVQAVVSLLLVELDQFPSDALVRLLGHYETLFASESIVCGLGLEFLPAVLCRVEPLAHVSNPVSGLVSSGAELQSRFINTVIKGPLPLGLVTAFTTMCKDIGLLAPDLLKVISRVLELMPALELQELPSLVYHLLLLSSRGHRAHLLKGLIGHMDTLLERPDSNSRMVESVASTVALHINFAMKQDVKLGKELIKLGKRSPEQITPFSLCLLLSCATVSRFEDAVIGTIKHGLVGCAKARVARDGSMWPALARDADLPEPPQLGTVLSKVLASTGSGWDMLVVPLMRLGFALADLTLRSVGYARAVLADVHGRADEILRSLFEHHAVVRAPLLEEVFSRIIALAPSADAHIALLGELVRRHAMAVAGFEVKFKELVNYLSYLNLRTAASLIEALVPVAAVIPSFLDHLMVVLKKALFSREVSSRLVALSGFLVVLKTVDTSDAAGGAFESAGTFDLFGSQAPLGSSTSSSSTVGGGSSTSGTGGDAEPGCGIRVSNAVSLAHEIMSHLKRCLTQQYAVRRLLYASLPEIVARVPAVTADVLELLYFQLNKYRVDGTGPPLNLGAALWVPPPGSPSGSMVKVLDDLPGLLKAVARVLAEVGDGAGGTGSEFARELARMFNDILERTVSAHAEDYELDKTANYATSEAAGLANHARATLYCGVLEVVMEAQVCALAPDADPATVMETAGAVYGKYHALRKHVAAMSGSRKGKFKKGKGMAAAHASFVKATVVELQRSVLSWTMRYRILVAGFAIAPGSVPHAAALTRHVLLSVVHDLSRGAKLSRNLAPGAGHDKPGGSAGVDADAACHTHDGFGAKANHVAATMFVARLGSVATRMLPVLAQQFDAARAQYEVEVSAGKAGPKGGGPETAAPAVVGDSYGDGTPQLTLVLRGIHASLGLVAQRKEREPGRWARVLGGLSNEAGSDVSAALGRLKGWASTLLTASWYEPLNEVLDILSELLEEHATVQERINEAEWAVGMVSNHMVLHEAAARKLVGIVVTTAVVDVEGSLLKLAHDVNRLLGALNTESVTGNVECEIVTDENVTAIVRQILGGVEAQLAQGEVLLTQLATMLSGTTVAATTNKVVEEGARVGEAYKELFDVLLVRVGELAGVLSSLCSSSLKSGPASDGTIKGLTHLFRTMQAIVKHVTSLKVKPGTRVRKLVADVAGVSSLAYTLISYLQTIANQGTSSRISKEQKLVPALIFAIEQFDVAVLSLSQATGVNLARNLKRAVARDFKIRTDVIAMVLESDPGMGGSQGRAKAKKKRKHEPEPEHEHEHEHEHEPEPQQQGEEQHKRARPMS